MNKSIKLILCILFPLLAGSVSGIATASGVNDWFQTINKPSFNPPNYLFGPVWTMLYILMGISFCILLIIYKPQFTWPGLIIAALGIPIYYLVSPKKKSNSF